MEYPASGELFWSLTPREYVVFMEAAAERERRAHNARTMQAWNTAAIPGSKKKLDDLLIKAPSAKSQTPEQRLAAAKAWAAVMAQRR